MKFKLNFVTGYKNPTSNPTFPIEPKEKDLYQCNESHLHVNLMIQK